ncbi:MAG: FAD-dependent oxidoreductase [Limisphaerales bacterium]
MNQPTAPPEAQAHSPSAPPPRSHGAGPLPGSGIPNPHPLLFPGSVPSRARVIVVGGGIAGTSVAYHLAQLGWTDVLVLEQNLVAGGTTWHAAGMVTRLRTSSSMMRINQASADLYARLHALTGHDIGWRQVGSLVIAETPERLTQYHRATAMARFLGVECHPVGPADCGSRFPGIRTDDLLGGYWIPHDGYCRPAEVPVALALGALRAGVTVVEKIRVASLLTRDGRVTGVEIADGRRIEAEHVVLCGGMWTRQLAAPAGVAIPLHPIEHHYVVSHPIDGVSGSLPCTRDMDRSIYFRGEDIDTDIHTDADAEKLLGGSRRRRGALILGAFQETTKPWDVPRIPDDFSFQLLEPDWPKFHAPLLDAVHRIPVLAQVGFARFVNGPESFTPDNQWLMGEAAECRGLFVLAGFNSAGIASAGGAGKALAEWIVGGAMPFDLTSVDIRRFGPWANDTAFLRERVTEALGLHYQMAWPNREFTTGRNQRPSPLHDRLAAAGACFGVKGGWERPNWFARRHPGCAREPVVRYGFGRQNWFANHAFEHHACRQRVAVFDQSGFAKLAVRGPGALAALQWLATNNVDVPVGRLVYTGLLNHRGGYEADLTIARLADDDFLVVTGSAQGVRDADWIRRNAPPGAEFELKDITEEYAVLGVMGPLARDLLTRVSSRILSNAAFPFGSVQRLVLGASCDALALRVTYVGELGWELHVPARQAPNLHSLLTRTGEDLGLANAGHYAIQSLRLEKGYRAFGAELSPDESPLDAGLGFTVAWDKPGGFLGRDALLQQKSGGVRKRLALFALRDPEPCLWGGEPVLRNGVPVGYTTSGAYGHTVGASVAMAYVRDPGGAIVSADHIREGRYEIELNGRRLEARVSLEPFHDPRRLRVLA